MKTAIQNFSVLIEPRHIFLEHFCDKAGARTKWGISNILRSALGSGKKEDDAFFRCRSALSHDVTLVHRKQHMRLCVYTDEADMFWSGIVTQIPGRHHTRAC